MHPKIRRLIRTNLRVMRDARRVAGTLVKRNWIERKNPSNVKFPGQKVNGLVWQQVPELLPHEAFTRNFSIVAEILREHEIDFWVVSWEPTRRHIIGVSQDDQQAALDALASSNNHPIYIRNGADAHFTLSARNAATSERILENVTLDCGVLMQSGPLRYGLEYGCLLEFWEQPAEEDPLPYVLAPRENRASRQLALSIFHDRTEVEIAGVSYPTLKILRQRMLDDVTFPIDVVYTWVDGSDPQWLEAKNKASGQVVAAEYHSEATHDARYRNRDELKYSLRSIDMFAPWVNHIYLVTAGQVPAWLDADHPKITIVDHKEIYPDEGYLPTFNSNSIISRLHHIPDLNEHYVYFNDDVMLTSFVHPGDFFNSAGVAKVFPSRNRRPFGTATADEEPHFNLTKQIRTLIEEEFGITVSRAIKHTPHAQLKSVHHEMETRFAEQYEKTWRSKFRHHDDIVADQLHHYYAQITGKAIIGNFNYQYINLLHSGHTNRLKRVIMPTRMKSVCFNDAPVPDVDPIPFSTVQETFDRAYPFRSQFEK